MLWKRSDLVRNSIVWANEIKRNELWEAARQKMKQWSISTPGAERMRRHRQRRQSQNSATNCSAIARRRASLPHSEMMKHQSSGCELGETSAKRVKGCFARLFRKSPGRDRAARLRHLFAASTRTKGKFYSVVNRADDYHRPKPPAGVGGKTDEELIEEAGKRAAALGLLPHETQHWPIAINAGR